MGCKTTPFRVKILGPLHYHFSFLVISILYTGHLDIDSKKGLLREFKSLAETFRVFSLVFQI